MGETRPKRLVGLMQILWYRFTHLFGLDSCPVEPPSPPGPPSKPKRP